MSDTIADLRGDVRLRFLDPVADTLQMFGAAPVLHLAPDLTSLVSSDP
jgi:hypothetical protein